MNVFIAVIIACGTPVAMTCQPMIKPEAFFEEKECLEEVEMMTELLTRKGVLNRGQCVPIKVGSST
jgi:hypothetical protein